MPDHGRTLKKHLDDSGWFRNLEAQKAWRHIIDIEIPSMMVIDGLIEGHRDTLPVYEVVDYWYRKYRDSYEPRWTTLFDLFEDFMREWQRKHHPALTIANRRQGSQVVPCIVVKVSLSTRRQVRDGETD
jgi:phosphoglycolate phosphatase-like HAD superfamily hydrolase